MDILKIHKQNSEYFVSGPSFIREQAEAKVREQNNGKLVSFSKEQNEDEIYPEKQMEQ